jgi:hypothetical protein
MNDPDTADLMAPPLAVRWRVGTAAVLAALAIEGTAINIYREEVA